MSPDHFNVEVRPVSEPVTIRGSGAVTTHRPTP